MNPKLNYKYIRSHCKRIISIEFQQDLSSINLEKILTLRNVKPYNSTQNHTCFKYLLNNPTIIIYLGSVESNNFFEDNRMTKEFRIRDLILFRPTSSSVSKLKKINGVEKLAIECYSIRIFDSIAKLNNLGNIRNLSLSIGYIPEKILYISKFVKLEKLDFKSYMSSDIPSFFGPRLMNLKKLHAFGFNKQQIIEIFLNFPNLKSMEYRYFINSNKERLKEPIKLRKLSV